MLCNSKNIQGDSSVTCVTFRIFSSLKLQIHVILLLTVLILIIVLFYRLFNRYGIKNIFIMDFIKIYCLERCMCDAEKSKFRQVH